MHTFQDSLANDSENKNVNAGPKDLTSFRLSTGEKAR